MPIVKQRVPFRMVCNDVEEVNNKLLKEIQELKQERPHIRDMQFNLNVLCGAIEKERQARASVENAAANAEAAHLEAVTQSANRVKELKRQIREAELRHTDSQAQIQRLGGLLGAAHVDAARALQREANKARREVEDATAEVVLSKNEAKSMVASRVKEFKRQIREAQARQIERLGGLLGVAHVEAARALEREGTVRREAEQLSKSPGKRQRLIWML
ncbi:hypothetical protein AB1Y20_020274 [Prymnesium parvum]|uniref:Uncharacterized protein n=1 Tax=Prymnesium parvum TaxID=97485 RepID=A0AB34JXN3_PRYPA